MKTGIEYALSDEKRRFDQIVAQALTPAAFASRVVISHEIRKHFGDEIDPVLRQKRNGANSEPIYIPKLRTLDDDTSRPYNALVHLFRRVGLDELPQMQNVRDGELSIAAARTLEPWVEADILEAADPRISSVWLEVVDPYNRGIISPFSIRNHRTPELIVPLANEKCVSDINYMLNSSLAGDIALLGRAMGAAVTGKL